ncbi:peptide chain release factor N(5)-glutamine methyltransferase [Aureimonas sp. D3]|uniref:peptide chain release factor N(5)-glutamine methyltransferase n=1 Tax=Aureimonas sp. D3 TaxID=1638164 RepID=UPI000782DFFA|nr:peptide chain release factor N(5)-glutamine methyltransferase [Aureimonas sp. D3]
MSESSLGALHRGLRQAFRQAGLATPDLDARLLLCDTLGLDSAGLILREGEPVAAEAAARLAERAARRLAGEPVGRILGRRFFYDHEFELSPETLEPRPDTEILVELAASAFRARGEDEFVFADIGTGTGAIAVSLLALFPQSRCVAVDLSEGALETARRNAEGAGVGARFWALRGDYLAALAPGSLTAIVSNPPYIPSADIETLDAGVREHDPMLALDGGTDGLTAYRALCAAAAPKLKPGGDLLLEIGIGQEGDVRALAREAGLSWRETRADLSGIARALWFCGDDALEKQGKSAGN